jgi:hypothetical protein
MSFFGEEDRSTEKISVGKKSTKNRKTMTRKCLALD